MATLQELIGSATLTGIVRGIRGGVPQTGLDPAFFTTRVRVEGDTALFHRHNATRRTSRRVGYGASPHARALIGLDQVPTKLIHSFESVDHQLATYMNLMSFDNTSRQQLGVQEVARQAEEFRRLFDNLRVSAVCSALSLGAIYFDGDGHLLPSSSGAVVTIDMQIPAANKTQLNMLGAGSIISASWATAGTDILGQIANLRAAYIKLTGYELNQIIYGANIRNYILSNTGCASLLQTHGQLAQAIAMQELPPGFAGVPKWTPGEALHYVDSGGTLRSWIGGDQIILLPEITSEVYELQEGTYPVPQSVGRLYASAEEALADVRPVQGMFSYAVAQAIPVPSLQQYAGDTFLPVIKVPNAFAIGDVTP